MPLYKSSLGSAKAFSAAEQGARSLCDEILATGLREAVFVKDMAYHAEAFLDDGFLASIDHAFLIRDPKFSIPSLYRMRRDFDERETGFAGAARLFRRIQAVTGKTPLVIDGEQLKQHPTAVVDLYFKNLGMSMPADLLNWPVGSMDEWADRSSWHVEATNSQGFNRVRGQFDPATLPNRVLRLIERDTPLYETLAAFVPALKTLTDVNTQ